MRRIKEIWIIGMVFCVFGDDMIKNIVCNFKTV